MNDNNVAIATREDELDRAALDQDLRTSEKLLSADLVRRMVESESLLCVFRTYRRLTQQAPAYAAQVSKPQSANWKQTVELAP